MNQQELRRKKNALRELTESFDSVSTEEDWRALAKFGVQRNQVWSLKIDLELFNFWSVVMQYLTRGLSQNYRISILRKHLVLLSRIANYWARLPHCTDPNSRIQSKEWVHGIRWFSGGLTSETPGDFTVVPSEGSLSSKEGIDFVVKFKPTNPGAVDGYLVIDTEDMKKTWKVIGSTA